jgi:anti-anti-sigma regulatory factor
VKTLTPTILPYTSVSTSAGRRALRKSMLAALRIAQSPVIIDLSGCRSFHPEDIDLLLACVAQVTGRDTQMLFVAGSPAIRVLLDLTRISLLVPVFDSMEEALVPQISGGSLQEMQINLSEQVLSA